MLFHYTFLASFSGHILAHLVGTPLWQHVVGIPFWTSSSPSSSSSSMRVQGFVRQACHGHAYWRHCAKKKYSKISGHKCSAGRQWLINDFPPAREAGGKNSKIQKYYYNNTTNNLLMMMMMIFHPYPPKNTIIFNTTKMLQTLKFTGTVRS